MTQGKMEALGIRTGDYVELRGRCQSSTVCVAMSDNSLTSDDLICMDKYVRGNLHVKVNDMVRISVCRCLMYASRVDVRPLEDTVNGKPRDLFESFLRPYFQNSFRSLTTGDIFSVRGPGRVVEFKVISVEPSPSIVAPGTKVLWQGAHVSRQAAESYQNHVTYEDIGGCGKSLTLIKEIVELPLRYDTLYEKIGIQPPRGFLMYGSPGTGKTLIARAVANETRAFFLLVNGAEMMNKPVGETEAALRQAFSRAEQQAPAIIFFDDLDKIAPKQEKSSVVGSDLVAKLSILMDDLTPQSQVVVIATANSPNNLDSALLEVGRFDCEVKIGLPDTRGRLEILQIHTRNLALSSDVKLDQIATMTNGYSGAQLARVCVMAGRLCVGEIMSDDNVTDVQVTQLNFENALQNVRPNDSREMAIESPKLTWDDVGGGEELKHELSETIQYPIDHSEKFVKYGQPPWKGAVFWGPPGTGKTFLARATAGQLKAKFILVKGPEILSSTVGQSEKNVRKVFVQAAAVAPCIVCFDELDSISRARTKDSATNDAMDRILLQLLTEIDSLQKNVFIIGTTNRPDVMDSAILRPGRLDQLVYIPLPDEKSRLQIFKATLSKSPVAKDVDLAVFANKTDQFSAADIKGVCQRACKAAIRECIKIEEERRKQESSEDSEQGDAVPYITKAHLMEGLRFSRVSISNADVQLYEELVKRFKCGKFPPSGEDDDVFDYTS